MSNVIPATFKLRDKFKTPESIKNGPERLPLPITLAIYCGLAIFLCIWIGYCCARKGIDFYTLLIAAKAFHQHARPYLNLMYTSYPYYYPPLAAQLVSPLIFLPPKLALLIWLIISAAAIICAVFLLAGKKRFPLYLILAFGFMPVETTLYAGQVGALLLFALSLAYYAGCKKNHWATGLGIGAGIMLKVIPLAHFFYFIYRGKFKAAFFTVIFLGILFLISLPFVGGLQGWLDFLHIAFYYGAPRSLHAVHFIEVLNTGANQSLSGFFARLITNDFWSITIWHISAIILVLATAVICWPRGNFNQLFPLEFSIITIAVNLIMPYTWFHQYIILLIPLLTFLKQAEHSPFLQRFIIPVAIGYVLTDIHGLFWHYFQNPLLSSFPTLFALFLWLILASQVIKLKTTVE